jgi:hypothetical protein
MENPIKASTATATTLIAIATSSMVEYRLGSKSNGMRHFWWQSSGSVDLDHAASGRVDIEARAFEEEPF